jgi:hypothetical protein
MESQKNRLVSELEIRNKEMGDRVAGEDKVHRTFK